MQFYPGQPAAHFPGARPEYAYAPAGPIATSPRMNWSPAMHPGAWAPYDFAAAYQAGYPPTSIDPRSPTYHTVSEHSGTPHNIRDILGSEAGASLPAEVAKTVVAAANYQKLPTSTAAGITIYAAEQQLRSPTTPTPTPTPTCLHPPGKPFEVVYSEIPSSFYPVVPARPMLPVGYDHTLMMDKGMEGVIPHPPGLIYAGHPPPTTPTIASKPPDTDKETLTGSKDDKRKKGRATFSGSQIDKLEEAFQATQYLTTAERGRLAERLALSESQVKIWFQNRRTKCRRTSWKSKK